jgi:hypothetical protein
VSRGTGGLFLFFFFFLPLLFVVGGPPVMQSLKDIMSRLPINQSGVGYWQTKRPIFYRLALWVVGLIFANWMLKRL